MRKRADGTYEAGRRSATGTRLDTYKIEANTPAEFRRAVQQAAADFCPDREVIIDSHSAGRFRVETPPMGGGTPARRMTREVA